MTNYTGNDIYCDLIIPRKAEIEVVKEVARTVKESEGACRVVTNLGEYQDSKHLHIHVGSGRPLVK